MICSKCQSINHGKANFCSKCGHKIEVNNTPNYKKHINKISIFFFVLLAYVGAINFITFEEEDYIQILLIDLFFALIVLLFSVIDFKTIIKLFKVGNLKKSLLIKIIIGAPLFALVVSFFADFLNQSIFDQSQITYYQIFIDSPAPITLSIISIGLFPALFEEIAFRGLLFDDLTKITGLKSTIIISAILFTILHLSLISILWIFPIGLLFGYFRAKHKNLWYGIIGHFVYNSSIVVYEIIALNNF